MGFFSKFEGKMEDTVEGAANKISGSGLSPVQIAKRAEKQMRREKIVGAGKQYAPTLYTVLVSPEDDARLFNYYPTLAGETETYLSAKAAELGLVMDGQPLVRFISDSDLKRGKFDVVAEMVASAIISRLRNDEMARYGLATNSPRASGRPSVARSRRGVARSNRAATNLKPIVKGGVNAADVAANVSYDFSDFDEPGGAHASRSAASNRSAAGASAASALAQGAAGIAGANAAEAAIGSAMGPGPVQATYIPTPHGTGSLGVTPLSPDASELDVYLYDAARDIAYVLTGASQSIGRESSNSVVVHDANASRTHAEIHMEPDGSWIITDLNSTNGVFINGRQITSAALTDADMIRIGTTDLEFQKLS